MSSSTCALDLTVICMVFFISSASCQLEICKPFLQDIYRDEFIVGGRTMALFYREKNWEDAMSHCNSIGMRLLTTDTPLKVDQLVTYLDSRIYTTRIEYHFWHLWLAATDTETNNNFIWQTTGQNVTNYYNWSPREPNAGTRKIALSGN